jgi:hypothetical protein
MGFLGPFTLEAITILIYVLEPEEEDLGRHKELALHILIGSLLFSLNV